MVKKGHRIKCKLCGMHTLGKSGLGEHLFIETEKQFEKHMEIYHPKKFQEISKISRGKDK